MKINQTSGTLRALTLLLTLAFPGTPELLSQSKSTSDDGQTILAKFSGGSISRSEFQRVLQVRFRENIPTGPRVREAFLRKYAILRIAAGRARAEGLTTSKSYIKQSALLKERVRIEAYRRFLYELPPRNVYRMMRMQILLLKPLKARKGPPDGTRAQGESPELARKAREIAARLNRPGLSQDEIENILAQHAYISRYKASGGLLTPQCSSCPWSPTLRITTALAKAPAKQFIYNYNRYGHMVVRRLGTDMVASADLKKYFTAFYEAQSVRVKRNIERIQDPQARAKTLRAFPKNAAARDTLAGHHRDFFLKREVKQRFRRRIEQLKNARELRVYPAASRRSIAAMTHKPETPLYRMSGRTFTYGELSALLPDPHFDRRARLRRLQFVITHRLLRGSLTYENVGKSKQYRALLTYASRAVLGRAYYDNRMPEVADVTAKQIRAEYDKNKTSRYRGLQFNRVRRRIMFNMQQQAYRAARAKFDAELTDKYKLRLFPERL